MAQKIQGEALEHHGPGRPPLSYSDDTSSVNIRMTMKQKKQLEAEAAAQGKSVSSYVRDVIAEYLEAHA